MPAPTDKPIFHLYCDESCHLEHDRCKVMVLGSVKCPAHRRQEVGRAIKALKKKYKIGTNVETKWTKVSPARVEYYLELVDLFYADADLSFRGIVVPDKSVLDHARFDQDHDLFYYKMWFVLLSRQIDSRHRARIFFDIKDTRGEAKVRHLHQVLCNSQLDFDKALIESIEQVRSHDVPLLQVTDLLTGALGYANRGLSTSAAKLAVVNHIRKRSGLSLTRTTLLAEDKTNILIWNSQQ